jgi:transposase
MAEKDVNKEYKISDEMWKQMEPLLPPEIATSSDGQPRMDNRKTMEGILYVFRAGCEWESLPCDFGVPSTVYSRFKEWREAGVFQRMWRAGFLKYDELRTLFWHGRPHVR